MSALLAAAGRIDTGDTAWMLVATALVLMMTPALGLFYAGLVRAKNTLNTFMMSVGAIAIATVAWAAIGYSLAFDTGNGFVGGLHFAFLNDVAFAPRPGTTIPQLLFFAYEATFCIITTALVSGAVVERMRFGAFMLFSALWSILVFSVLAHWVWGGGWLQEHGTLDFAGGVPVEMASGFSALAAALVVRSRKDYGRQALLPHNAVYVLLGAGLLWFGWFGFNGGIGYSTGHPGVLAFTNTLLCPACTLVAWFLLDLWRGGRITAVGAATAIIVGCVGITPAAGFVSPAWAMVLGAVAAVPSYFVIVYRTRTRVDETLDVLAGVVMLRDAQRPADHRAWRARVGKGRIANDVGGNTGLLLGEFQRVFLDARAIRVEVRRRVDSRRVCHSPPDSFDRDRHRLEICDEQDEDQW